jgi:hypothetical protein
MHLTRAPLLSPPPRTHTPTPPPLQAYSLQENYKAAVDVYLEALEFSPENPGEASTPVPTSNIALPPTPHPNCPLAVCHPVPAGCWLPAHLRCLSLAPVVCADLLTTVGLLYLRLGENVKAFEYLGNSLTYDPKNPKVLVHSPVYVCTCCMRLFFCCVRSRSLCGRARA